MTDRPFDLLKTLAIQEVELAPGLKHVEIYTMGGLLTLLWHGDPEWERVVVACGGAMGGMLGPAGGLYHDLGTALAANEYEIGVVRVGYRRPNDLEECTLDLCAAADLAARGGGKRFVTMGHSFGGAVAVNAAVALPNHVVGVVGLATQSAGCEVAQLLGEPDRPHDCRMLLLHGDADELLPPDCSFTVQMLAGLGEVEILPGAGHLLTQAGTQLRERLLAWLPETLGV